MAWLSKKLIEFSQMLPRVFLLVRFFLIVPRKVDFIHKINCKYVVIYCQEGNWVDKMNNLLLRTDDELLNPADFINIL